MARKTTVHTSLSTDIKNFKIISSLVEDEIKIFNSISDSIKSLSKQIIILEKTGDDVSKKEAEKLRTQKDEKQKLYDNYSLDIEKGSITEKVLKNFSNTPKEFTKSKQEDITNTLSESIQIMIEKRFIHNEIKNSFGKKNLNYFSGIEKSRI